jgi:heme exporter protein C
MSDLTKVRPQRSWLDVAGGVTVLAAVAMAFLTPAEQTQGDVARLLYLHVPAVIAAYLAFALALVGSIGYLASRKMRWDHLAVAGAEVGVVFTGLVLVIGMIWAKPTWGVYWTWTPRLILTAIMFFVYLGYLGLRRAIADPAARARRAAMFGALSIVQVPIIHFSVLWWRDIHQQTSGLVGPGPLQMDPILATTFRISMVSFVVAGAALVRRRLLLARIEHAVETAVMAGAGEVAGSGVAAPKLDLIDEGAS